MNSRMPRPLCDLIYDAPITEWEDAIPLGNGLLGCLLWGEGNALRMTLDRGDLWDNTPCEGIFSPDFTYRKMASLAQKGEVDAIRRIFTDINRHPTPTKIPAGKLILDFGEGWRVSSRLALACAEAGVTLERGEEGISLQSYLHAQKRAGFVKVSIPSDAYSVHLKNPDFGVKGEEYTDLPRMSLKHLKYDPPVFGEETDLRWYLQRVNAELSYALLVASRNTPSGSELCYTVASSLDGADWLKKAGETVRALLEEGYDANREAHREWWAGYWDKSAVRLPDPLYEKNWYLVNYLFGACSRKGCPPMPLQGVWTADNGEMPPWKGDYHHDLNTQMSYYHYLKANHLPEGESFLDYLWSLQPAARAFAKSFYGAAGACLPSVMAIDGTALSGWPMYSLAPTNQLWLCQLFERHYTYTGDEAFLRGRAYPYLKETAEFILCLLKEDDKGFLTLPVSSSPELHNDNLEAWVTPNSNYDQALLLYLFRQLSRFARLMENGEEKRWEEVLHHLAPLAVNAHNVLMVSPDESLLESQRHFAHAMAIHPLRLLDPDRPGDREIIDATVHNMEDLGYGQWVGFSFPWFAEFFALQRNGEGAAYHLKLFWECFCARNGFNLNGDFKRRGLSWYHYRPFTLEGTICGADALQEMLLKSENGVLELFPAIPEEWKRREVAFEDFRGERGILISARYEAGALRSLTLKPQFAGEYAIRDETGALAAPCPSRRRGEHLILTLEAGKEYLILPA